MSFMNFVHVDTDGTIERLVSILWKTNPDAFDSILSDYQRKIDAYEQTLALAVRSSRAGGQNKQAASILSVAVTGARLAGGMNQEQQALLFHSSLSQIQRTVKYVKLNPTL